MDRYLQIETATGPSFHPQKPAQLSFVYNGPSVMQIFSTESQDSQPLWPKQLTYEPHRCTDASYLPNGILLFHTDVDGNENWQIGSSEETASSRKTHMHTKELASKHLVQFASDTYLYFTANWTDRKVFDLYRVAFHPSLPEVINPSTATLLYSNSEPGVLLSVMTVSTQNKRDEKLVLRLIHGNTSHHLIELDLETLKPFPLTRSITKADEKWRWDHAHYLTPTALLVVTDYQKDLTRFSVLDLGDRTQNPKLVECQLDSIPESTKYEVDEVYTPRDFPSAIFTYNTGGYTSLFTASFHPDGTISNLRPLSELLPAEGVISSGDTRTSRKAFSLSSDKKHLAFNFSCPQYPSNIYSLLLDGSAKAKPLTAVQTGGLKAPDAFSPTSLGSFTASDGLQIPYFVTLPLQPKESCPVVIKVHGGPESQLRPSFSYLSQFIAANGFVVVEPNIRGSSGYGKFYLDADNIEKRLDSIRDLAELVQHLRGNPGPFMNPMKCVVWGASYGGFATLSAITEYPDLWSGAVDLFGISNFETFLESTAAWRRKLREAEYGSLDLHRDVLKRISPIHRCERICVPLFLFQGDADERVPLKETLQMYDKLVGLGKVVKLVRLPDEGHGITKRENVLNVYSQILNFLKEHVSS